MNSFDPVWNAVMTRGGQLSFQHVNLDDSTGLRVTSAVKPDGVPLACVDLSSRAAGGPFELAASREGVMNITVTGGPNSDGGSLAIEQFDRIGQSPATQAIVNFPGAGIGIVAGMSRDKPMMSRVLRSPDGSLVVTEARDHRQPGAVPSVVDKATTGGVVFDDANGSTYCEKTESGVAERQVFIDANNNDLLGSGKKPPPPMPAGTTR